MQKAIEYAIIGQNRLLERNMKKTKINTAERIRLLKRKIVAGGLILASTVFGAGKAHAQSQSNNTQKANVTTVTKTNNQNMKPDTLRLSDASTMYNEIMNMAVEELLENPNFVEDAANDSKFVAEISKNPEIIAQLMQQTGMNTLNNFNFQGFEWTAEYLQDMKNDGKMSKTLKKNMYKVDRENTDGVHCLSAVKAGLRTIGFDCPATSPYQMPSYMDKSDKFVKIDLHNNYGLLYNVDDCSIILQNRNVKDSRVKHGHSCFAWTDKNGNRVQKCGLNGPKGYPTSDRRNTNTSYDGFWCYVPSDGHVSGNLLVELIKEGRVTIKASDLIKSADPEVIARLYIENTNLKNMYGLDQIAKPSKATKTAKVTKAQSNTQTIDKNSKDDKNDSTKQHLAKADKPLKAPSDKSKLLKAKDIAALIRDRNRSNRV